MRSHKRTVLRTIGNVLVAASLVGLLLTTFGLPSEWLDRPGETIDPADGAPVAAESADRATELPSFASDAGPAELVAAPAPTSDGMSPGQVGSGAASSSGPVPTAVPAPTAVMAGPPATPVPFLPVTGIVMPRIALEAEIVPARLVEKNGGVTWEVPAFKAGHAEATAGAGGFGNVVLLGHVASRNAGNVFQDLDEARVGDQVQVYSGTHEFQYRVVDVRKVSRTDVSVVKPTETASLSLITCTGVWLPLVRDYAERLVVRAELTGPAVSSIASRPAPAAPASATAAPASATAAPPTPSAPTTLRTVFEEGFAEVRPGWPNDPQSTAWFADGVYRLVAREPARFVAVGAPIAGSLGDVVVSGTFRKVGGPPGGGYGLIVRDQGPGPRDGRGQGGRYYVLEAGDRGELGIWRREGDHWVDIVPWTPSAAVRPGEAANELTVRAIGSRLTFLVNGTEVASRDDAALSEGGVGLFVGGDLNEVAAERFVVQVPAAP